MHLNQSVHTFLTGWFASTASLSPFQHCCCRFQMSLQISNVAAQTNTGPLFMEYMLSEERVACNIIITTELCPFIVLFLQHTLSFLVLVALPPSGHTCLNASWIKALRYRFIFRSLRCLQKKLKSRSCSSKRLKIRMNNEQIIIIDLISNQFKRNKSSAVLRVTHRYSQVQEQLCILMQNLASRLPSEESDNAARHDNYHKSHFPLAHAGRT